MKHPKAWARLAGDFDFSDFMARRQFTHYSQIVLDRVFDVIECFLLVSALRDTSGQAWTRHADAFFGFAKDDFVCHENLALRIADPHG